jgi:hypothetical protein
VRPRRTSRRPDKAHHDELLDEGIEASRPAGRRPAREPIIRNWRGLLIVLFLLLVAPLVARWASAVILGLLPGH